MVTIAVTGAAGFIGRALCDAIESGGSRVLRIDRRLPGRSGLDLATCPAGLLRKRLRRADVVVHAAWSTYPPESVTDPYRDSLNVPMTIRLLEACRGTDISRFVFLSSAGTVYGKMVPVPVHEDSPTNPVVPYGISKLAAERLVLTMCRDGGIRPVVARLSNPYGPGQFPDRSVGVVAKFIAAGLAKKTIEFRGAGSAVRDFVYIDDVADALLRLSTSDISSDVFNIGSGIGTSISDLAAMLAHFGAGSLGRIRRGSAAPYDSPAIVLLINRIRHETGWYPYTSLDKGLEQTIAWHRSMAAR